MLRVLRPSAHISPTSETLMPLLTGTLPGLLTWQQTVTVTAAGGMMVVFLVLQSIARMW